ncbi:type II toxin-antitoxin system RelE/ParE family toxin [Mesorhizobium sp. LHD-90]|uniref:type II toxin-antitoxin system RelE/ParE family toxin n=1 Tax=Mesorhizobium sp. LHD-90 TaxID=3071414 RepID=UPI0027DFC122|nr:type II toxin-antitoxin system RelE/ParE family toxin [Mesorhizobium sp. LHD-90]MDQ6437328.1 type II toxin-antitoxin system RelE/ParE family toxin [Mesorhizobium sp. LHD-90]
MSGYVLSRAAQADLDGIWDYTEKTWNQDQAERYINSIKDACEALASRRKFGRNAEQFRAGYFRHAIGSHFIFYTLSDGGDVQVMRILHRRMDLKSRLEE